jgi:hypothetical protein
LTTTTGSAELYGRGYHRPADLVRVGRGDAGQRQQVPRAGPLPVLLARADHDHGRRVLSQRLARAAPAENADNSGTALYCQKSSARPVVTDCAFIDNAGFGAEIRPGGTADGCYFQGNAFPACAFKPNWSVKGSANVATGGRQWTAAGGSATAGSTRGPTC